ncbi:MAG: serine hydrolase [Bacteroides sp.]|nr:serine hydrolase [Bacteroides sp.]
MKRITLSFLLLFVIIFSALAESVAPPVVVRNHDGVLPVSRLADRDIALVTLGRQRETDFEDICSRYAMIETEHVSSEKHLSDAMELAEDSDLIIVAVGSSDRWIGKALKKLCAKRPVIAVFFIKEDKIEPLTHGLSPAAVIRAADNSPESQSLAAQMIFGGRATESFPKSRLGYASSVDAGFSPDLEKRIDSIVAQSISRHAFPGCQVVVARKGDVVIDKAYGTYSFDDKTAVSRNTLFDIASMTKATATLAGLMKAYDQGRFNLRWPASSYLPRMRDTALDGITVRDLLFHESGLPASINVYSAVIDTASYSGRLFREKPGDPYTIKLDKGLYANNTARLRADLFSTAPSRQFPNEIARNIFATDSAAAILSDLIYSRRPGAKKYLYSDLNFCILKDLEEAVTGTAHDKWVDTRIFLPLGAHRSTYCPVSNGWEPSDVAPTENDRLLRRQHLQGYVHDETAAFLGGVSGNAGFFSTAGDIAKLCQTWLNGGTYGDARIFSPETVKLFTTTRSDANRGLGFDLAGRVKSFRDTGINPLAYGHTGFTGTCFWVDPAEEIIIVILTNRVNPTRDTPTFNTLAPRQEIIRAVYTSLHPLP